ncbi:MAG TPA: hypothetical protein VFM70_04550 [Salinimicrobium sp.]|nr:hypothetical protein [Salinimicrobium sp.]
MPLISNFFVPIIKVPEVVENLLKNEYHLHHYHKSNSLKTLENYLDHLKKDLWVLIEHPYVDKVYRDSFYHYYSSKNQVYSRDCIKLSFFTNEIDNSLFRSSESKTILQDSFLGFLVLRPTFPKIIGRSVLSPLSVEENNFKICKAEVSTTANGVKLLVNGFPHSSQNSETITCAETTIWSVMEYFGMRYPEYSPTLPSKISKILAAQSFERQLPSKGLTAQQISYALRELGFGVKIYSAASYKTEFLPLLRSYIESGIPVVAAIQNNRGIGHAQCIIGRTKFNDESIDILEQFEDYGNEVKIFQFETVDLKYVFIDDNHPPYKISPLDEPSSFYSLPNWKDCKIVNFVVPLYSKIYLDAGEARAYAKSILKNYIANLQVYKNKDLVMKTFLASSRSYKDYLACNPHLEPLVKEILMRSSMPKFIWISELSSKKSLKQEMVDGLLIIDATQTKQHGLIAGLLGNYYFTENLNEIVKINISLQPFKSYNFNLK